MGTKARTSLPLSPIADGSVTSPSTRSPTVLPSPSHLRDAVEPELALVREPVRSRPGVVNLRGDTLFSSPPPPLHTTTPAGPARDERPPLAYYRPRAFRTLHGSFLPSRSARVVMNRYPVVDSELTDEER